MSDPTHKYEGEMLAERAAGVPSAFRIVMFNGRVLRAGWGLLVFAALFAPALWIAVQFDLGWLGPKPDVEGIHQFGLWAVRILLVSLAVSPLRRIAQWNKLIAVRRMLGVAVLFYGLGHFALYNLQQGFDLPHVAREILLRF